MKNEVKLRNRDAGLGGHPTQFAPKRRNTSTLAAVDLLSAAELSGSSNNRGVIELIAYRDSVEAGTVIPPGFNAEAGNGTFFLKSLDKQITYARRGETESADSLRFHQLRLGAQEKFVVDGKSFAVELDDTGDASLIFNVEVTEFESPTIAGMCTTDRETYEHEVLEHVMAECGAKSISSHGGTATVRVKSRRPQFNSLPDCVNKISDAELDFFIAADSFRQKWLATHVKSDDTNWLENTEQKFVS